MKSLPHLSAKGKHGQDSRTKESSLVHEMEEKEIEEAIQRDLATLSSKHSWRSLVTLLNQDDEASPEAELLLRLDILLKQNELILRALKRKSPISGETAHVSHVETESS